MPQDRISTLEDQLPSISCGDSVSLCKIIYGFWGVPEKEKGRDSITFFESWLADDIGRNILSPFYAIEQAHRVPTCPSPTGALPHPILIQLLQFRDWYAIPLVAREKGNFIMQGHKVSFFTDFSSKSKKE